MHLYNKATHAFLPCYTGRQTAIFLHRTVVAERAGKGQRHAVWARPARMTVSDKTCVKYNNRDEVSGDARNRDSHGLKTQNPLDQSAKELDPRA